MTTLTDGSRTGRTALVTGAASGIGRAVVDRLVTEGARVIAVDLHEPPISLANVRAVKMDQANAEDLTRAFSEIHGPLDTAVINAGVAAAYEHTVDMDVATIQHLIEVNLLGTILVARAAVTRMRSGGALVLTSSTAGLEASPGAAVYAATKAGVIAFGRSLALEVASRGITVNTVCPGGVRTPLLMATLGHDADDQITRAAARNPLGRLAEPDDIAAAICFLASAEARHITGTELVVNGGRG